MNEHIRKCAGCAGKFDREGMIRVLKNSVSGEILINPDNYTFGRSVYICKNKQHSDSTGTMFVEKQRSIVYRLQKEESETEISRDRTVNQSDRSLFHSSERGPDSGNSCLHGQTVWNRNSFRKNCSVRD